MCRQSSGQVWDAQAFKTQHTLQEDLKRKHTVLAAALEGEGLEVEVCVDTHDCGGNVQ